MRTRSSSLERTRPCARSVSRSSKWSRNAGSRIGPRLRIFFFRECELARARERDADYLGGHTTCTHVRANDCGSRIAPDNDGEARAKRGQEKPVEAQMSRAARVN